MKAAGEDVVGFGAGEPACVKGISKTVVTVKGCSIEELSTATRKTAKDFFPKLK